MKVLIPIHNDDVAPRFDLATEVYVAEIEGDGTVLNERTIVLPQASSEDLCSFIVREGVDLVICGGIEDEFYQYLRWKSVTVIDSVMDSYANALDDIASRTREKGS
ncbi:MAG: NifB/NifX family molybdenum-iron cluster-binding protein [Desulfovibrionales bacterium]